MGAAGGAKAGGPGTQFENLWLIPRFPRGPPSPSPWCSRSCSPGGAAGCEPHEPQCGWLRRTGPQGHLCTGTGATPTDGPGLGTPAQHPPPPCSGPGRGPGFPLSVRTRGPAGAPCGTQTRAREVSPPSWRRVLGAVPLLKHPNSPKTPPSRLARETHAAPSRTSPARLALIPTAGVRGSQPPGSP